MTIKEMFSEAIKKSMQSADNIIEADKKAMAYAAIASALAESGLLLQKTVTDIKEEKDSLKPENNKTKEKQVENKEEKPIVEEPKKEIQEATATPKKEVETEPEDEWNDTTKEKYKEELEFIQQFDKDCLNECLNVFLQASEGEYTIKDLTPDIIQGFCTFLKKILAEQEE